MIFSLEISNLQIFLWKTIFSLNPYIYKHKWQKDQIDWFQSGTDHNFKLIKTYGYIWTISFCWLWFKLQLVVIPE